MIKHKLTVTRLFKAHAAITMVASILLINVLILPVLASEEPVNNNKPLNIKRGLYSVTVTHGGETIEIHRNQNRSNLIDEDYRTTGKGAILAMRPFDPEPVETIGELEVLAYLEKMESGDNAILLIDARTSGGFNRGTIPGSINISFRALGKKERLESLFKEKFNVPQKNAVWDFSNAKTLVVFCHGPWCRQSVTFINRMLRAGYPAEKLKFYRGGMQAWHSFGLTVVVPWE